MRRYIVAAVLLPGILALGQDKSLADKSKHQTAYVLGPEDQIVIHALNAPDVSEKPVRLDAGGDFKLPMIGRVQAAGLTVEQLEAEVTKRLAKYLEEPEVSVTVMEFQSQPVSVIGEVGTPGVHQLRGDKTLIEVLSLAGGIKPSAAPVLRITRRKEYGRIPLATASEDAGGAFSVGEISIKSLMEASTPENNILVRPYDVISVPRALMVYVLGEVVKAGPLSLSEGQTISVLEAISASGGVQRTASTSKTKILRPIMGGPKRAELTVDVKKMLKGQTNDLPLLAGDILFVPGSSGKRATAQAIQSAIAVGTTVATYGVYR